MPADPLRTVLLRLRRWLVLARATDALFAAVVVGGAALVLVTAVHRPAAWPVVVSGLIAAAVTWRRPPTLAGTAAWLDQRHALADLLSTAWACRDSGEAWARTVVASADATAAALPPPGRLARFSTRHHACGIAAVAAAWLGTALLPGADRAPVVATTAGTTADAAPHTAAVVRRAAETADEATAVPGPAEDALSAGRRAGDRRSDAGRDAAGNGRSDTATPARVPVPDASPSLARPDAAGAGAGGGVASRSGEGPVAGAVTADPSAPPGGPAAGNGSADGGPARASTAGAVPDEHRDLVRAFFDR